MAKPLKIELTPSELRIVQFALRNAKSTARQVHSRIKNRFHDEKQAAEQILDETTALYERLLKAYPHQEAS